MSSVADDVGVAGGRDEDVRRADDLVERRHLVALHGRLERVDRVDLGDDHSGALPPEALRAPLADVAVAEHDGRLAADHHVGRPVDGVDEAVATAVEVVELRLGDRVVDVDRREEQLAPLEHLVEAVDAGRRLLGDALQAGGHAGPLGRIGLEGALEEAEHDGQLGVAGRRRVGDLAGLLVLDPLVHEERGVTAVVQDHVGAVVAVPGQCLLGAPPVLLERLALPGEDRHALGVLGRALRTDDDRGGRVVLGGEDVAAGPAHLGAELGQGLDEHGRLDGHVQRAGDAGAGQRLERAELLAQRAQAGHLVLGEVDLPAPEGGHGEVGDAEVAAGSEGRWHGSLHDRDWLDRGLGPTGTGSDSPRDRHVSPARPASRPSSRPARGSARGPRRRRRPGAARSRRRPARGRTAGPAARPPPPRRCRSR